MADDGSGADITIPSFLLYKPDADAVKTKLRETDFVQVRCGIGVIFTWTYVILITHAQSNRPTNNNRWR
jgi:hypothetical protein